MIIAGTGHRPVKLGGYSDEVFNKLRGLALRWLMDNKDVETVISGMAVGFDMALAMAALSSGRKLICAVPFRGQEAIWPTNAKDMYNAILQQGEVVIVSEGGYANWKMQKRNVFMCDRADTILALWDGTSGGTFNCVKYAQSKQKPIVNLWETWKGQ